MKKGEMWITTSSETTNSTSAVTRRPSLRSKSLSNMESYTTNEISWIKESLLRTTSHLEPSTLKTFTSKQKMTLISLVLAQFLSFCSLSIMAPFFPREAAEKGMSATTSGLIFSFYALVSFLASPIFGKILPRFGAKFLFLAGLFTAGFCNLLFGCLEYVYNYYFFTGLCVVIRGFEALGASAFYTASYVFVISAFPHNIGSVLGVLQIFLGLGISTGPALGGLLYSLGGFNTPFLVLGAVIVVFVPINAWLLPNIDDSNTSNESASIWKLIKIAEVVITGLVVVILASTWSFLDPTLEPHLRQFHLTPQNVGLTFLLYSALYGIFSPIWGCLADRINNHWSMMVVGIFTCTVGLLLLGPCPYLWFLTSSLRLTIVALSIIGISVALALLPTFQGVLNAAIKNGCEDNTPTFSLVAGIWSSMYSLGEVIGPSLGGFFLERYDFPITATIMAALTLTIGMVTLIFFSLNITCQSSDVSTDSGISETWGSYSGDNETTPLLASTSEANHRIYTEERIMS